jgi:hypothetical protein
MIPFRSAPLALALVLAVGASGCAEQTQQAAAAIEDAKQTVEDAKQTAEEAQQAIAEAKAEGGAISQAFAEAREKLQTENLPLSAGEGVPKAELTPQGDLLVGGVAVPMTPEQREAALAFRTEVLAVGDLGIAMGEKGVGLAGDALALAAKGIFGGDTAAGEAAIEAQGKAMEAEAKALCDRVEGLDAAQKRLAELLPAFAPYSNAIEINADCNVGDTAKDAERQAEDAAATDTVST